jgi:cysteinyl-tRNA synthetase
MKFKIYNTLSKKIETFQPFSLPQVKIYTCGPTVYDDLTIGNWRTYTLSDLLVRTLKIFGFKPKYIMNITDVGHLTGDNLGDADLGEDKMEKAAKKENKTAWDVAEFYTQSFKQGYKQLNLTEPEKFTKATDHIQEQINLVKQIYKKGFSYKTKDGIYFDVQAYEKAGNKYGQLSTLDKIKEGARVARNPDKKDPRDFALWKFSPKNEQRQMEWDSPWGKGFPGWHIECSAMSMKYLGDQLDIHVGGEDLKSIHHPNEIAQSEAATGKKPFVKYWVHGAFLLVNGGRMGKSLGNAYTLKDIKNKNFEFLTLRYFYLTGHYRKQLNFTWQALKASQTAFFNLKQAVLSLRAQSQTSRVSEISPEQLKKVETYKLSFNSALAQDLNLPEALAVVWEVLKSNIPSEDKYELILSFDEVLGLNLSQVKAKDRLKVSQKIKDLLKQRQKLRQKKKWQEADVLREKIENLGFIVEDTDQGQKIKPKLNAG